MYVVLSIASCFYGVALCCFIYFCLCMCAFFVALYRWFKSPNVVTEATESLLLVDWFRLIFPGTVSVESKSFDEM